MRVLPYARMVAGSAWELIVATRAFHVGISIAKTVSTYGETSRTIVLFAAMLERIGLSIKFDPHCKHHNDKKTQHTQQKTDNMTRFRALASSLL
jgi:metal-dependent HD superfamily phosphatase/phosphodiesterase